jgi:hypothetical protein
MTRRRFMSGSFRLVVRPSCHIPRPPATELPPPPRHAILPSVMKPAGSKSSVWRALHRFATWYLTVQERRLLAGILLLFLLGIAVRWSQRMQEPSRVLPPPLSPASFQTPQPTEPTP